MNMRYCVVKRIAIAAPRYFKRRRRRRGVARARPSSIHGHPRSRFTY